MDKELKFVNMEPTESRRARETSEYRKRKTDRRKNIKIKKQQHRKKNVAKAVLFAAGMSLSIMGRGCYERYVGTDYVLNNFHQSDESYDTIGVLNLSNGLSVTRTDRKTGKTEYISLDEGISYILNRARETGFSDEECYIILSDQFTSTVAKDTFPELSMGDIMEAKEYAFHESKVEQGKGARL